MKKYFFYNTEGIQSICEIENNSRLKINKVITNKVLLTDKIHYHPEGDEYYICLKGKAKLEIENRIVDISKGEIILVYSGEKHKVIEIIEEIEFFVIRTNNKVNDKIEIKVYSENIIFK